MLDKLKNFFKKDEVKAPKKPREKKAVELSAKEKATQAGEPFIDIIGFKVDKDNIHEGEFSFDYNSIFLTQLIKAGYMKKKDDTDQDILDRWFQDICRQVALEMYEQSIADPENRYRADMRVVRSKDLGDGRSEIS